MTVFSAFVPKRVAHLRARKKKETDMRRICVHMRELCAQFVNSPRARDYTSAKDAKERGIIRGETHRRESRGVGGRGEGRRRKTVCVGVNNWQRRVQTFRVSGRTTIRERAILWYAKSTGGDARVYAYTLEGGAR